jgi:polyhydroxyalkanoate synthase subunit PhaE
MSEKIETNAANPDLASLWAELWQSVADSSGRMAATWSSSMAPFVLGRVLEQPAGFSVGNEMSEAIEKMAQGPRLADIWDIDRKLVSVFGAFVEMRQRLEAYNAIAAVPWTEASKRFLEKVNAVGDGDMSHSSWREVFAKWSEIANEELIKNQRTDGFLKAQKELLQAGLQLRSRQDDVAEAISTMFGLPTRKDFDDVTRQLTELRREVRALKREQQARSQDVHITLAPDDAAPL